MAGGRPPVPDLGPPLCVEGGIVSPLPRDDAPSPILLRRTPRLPTDMQAGSHHRIPLGAHPLKDTWSQLTPILCPWKQTASGVPPPSSVTSKPRGQSSSIHTESSKVSLLESVSAGPPLRGQIGCEESGLCP